MGNIIVNLAQYKRQKVFEWDREITVNEIATTTGVTRKTIRRWLSGEVARPSDAVIAKLCDFFNVADGEPVPFLIYRRDEAHPPLNGSME